VKHFSLHKVGVMIRDGCETMVHGVQMMLDLHPNWVVLQVDVHNAFNSVSQLAISRVMVFT
jgi:hypothetical protein